MTAPGVFGGAGEAAAFAGRWSELANASVRPVRAMRVYGFVGPPCDVGAAGRLRMATPGDRDRLVEMMAGFYRDIRDSGNPEATVDARLSEGLYRVLEIDGCVPTAIGHTRPFFGAALIQFLWTDPAFRRRGYGVTAVAALSAHFHAESLRPMLFTDLADPATNRLYRRLGYQAVPGQLRYGFDVPGP